MDLETLQAIQAGSAEQIKEVVDELNAFNEIGNRICSYERSMVIRELLKYDIKEIKERYEQILPQLPKEEIAEAIKKRNHIQSVIISGIRVCDELEKERTASIPIQPQYSNAVSSTLPPLKLPEFDGKAGEYPNFWNGFRIVHDDKGLRDATKLSYLVGQLRGNARDKITDLAHNDANYSHAIEILETAYGDKNELMNTYLDNLIFLKTTSHDLDNFTKFVNQVECNIRQLQSLDKELVEYQGLVLARLIEVKLPATFKDQLNRKKQVGRLSLNELRKHLQQELAHLKAAPKVLSRADNRQYKSTNRTVLAVSTEVSRVNKNNNKTKQYLPCCFCKGSHPIYECPNYKTVSERRDRTRELRQCFNCFKTDHMATECPNPRRCFYCDEAHHRVLCLSNNNKQQSSNYGCKNYNNRNNNYKGSYTSNQQNSGLRNQRSYSNQNQQNYRNDNATQSTVVAPGGASSTPTTTSTVATVSAVHRATSTVLNTTEKRMRSNDIPIALPTAMMKIFTPEGVCKLKGLLDLGSQKSFILRSVVNEAKLRIFRRENLIISGFDHDGTRTLYDIVSINVATYDGNVRIEAIVIDYLPPVNNPPALEELAIKLSARGITVADDYQTNPRIDILVGADNYYKFVETQLVENVNLIRTKLGSLISGPVHSVPRIENENYTTNVVTALNISVSKAPTDVDMFWRLDTIGINRQELHPDENLAIEKFEKNIKRVGTKYVSRLPWKEGEYELPSNYGLSLGRLKTTLHNLQQDPKRLEIYDKIIKEQLELDFIEEVDTSVPTKGKVIHYLPHHAVFKDSVSTPLRIVFDCSSKNGNKLSLNDTLLSGPSMVPELTKVLMRFRTDNYAITSDIKRAFLNIALAEEDRDATRFLWSENPYEKELKVKIYRFKSVLFGATCSQFILNATLKHHLENVAPEDQIHASNLNRNLYVDNIFHTSNVAVDIDKFYDKATEIMADAALELRGWATNAEEIATKIAINKTLDERPNVPLLGLYWNVNDDTLSMKPHPVKLQTFTKRAVLQALAAQYDPIGLVSPALLPAKIFMQEIWQQKYGWDDVLSEQMINKWCDIAKELNQLNSIIIPRYAVCKGKVTLHAFADASMKAYGAAIYAVQDAESSLLFSKARVAPLKELTIPKLELTAVVLATRLIEYVMNAYSQELHVEQVHIYSDSQVTLGQIKSKQSLEVYVQNRVNEIKQNAPEAKWHYVSTKENPADILSRGIKVTNLKNNKLWWHGPDWLINNLPPEVAEQPDNHKTVLTTATNINKLDDPIMKIIESSSTIEKAIRLHARLIRFVKLWKVRKSTNQFKNKWKQHLTADEVKYSEKQLVIAVQRHSFPEIIKYINSETTPKGKSPTLCNQLKLNIRDELIVCVTRITAAEVPDSAKYPILLPTKHHFSDLIIRRAHETQLHMGMNSTVACIRERYWLPKARQRIKGYIQKCIKCRRTEGVAYTRPPMAPLPAVRVCEARPFTNVGVDYAGPFNITENKMVVKRWIALFTCASTRAVHLEIAQDLSASSFIQVLQRFASRRSFPSTLISDNGSNFKATAEILQKWQNNSALQDILANKKCKWQFNPSRAAWMGGFFERLIGLTKRSLNKILGNRRVTTEEFHTLICRIEAQLNDRPLTYVSDQADDFPPLTPSMLVYGHRLDSVPEPTIDPDDLDPNEFEPELLNKRQKHNKLIFQNFMKRWSTEYLLMLKQDHNGNKTMVIPKEGDVVVIHDDNCARIHWQLGRIETLLPGRDGHVRVARVKTKNGMLIRPIIKLYPLEVKSPNDSVVTPSITEVPVDNIVNPDVDQERPSEDSSDDTYDSASEFEIGSERGSSTSSRTDDIPTRTTKRQAAQSAKERIRQQSCPKSGNM